MNIPVRCGVSNAYDGCLSQVMALQHFIHSHRPRGGAAWRFGAPPWVLMPRSGQRFQKVETASLPAAEGVDTLLLTYRVPLGYDGIMSTVTCLFSGWGFTEGSGDIHWRYRNNLRWYKDLGDLQISLGDLQYPYALEGAGYRLFSNQIVRVYANLGAGALGRLNPAGRLIVGITGWIYPQTIYQKFGEITRREVI